jgi:hypothetical protein
LDTTVVAGVDLSETDDAGVRSFFFPTDHGEETQPLRIIPESKKPIIKDDLLMTECMIKMNEDPETQGISPISRRRGGMVLKRLVSCKMEFNKQLDYALAHPSKVSFFWELCLIFPPM